MRAFHGTDDPIAGAGCGPLPRHRQVGATYGRKFTLDGHALGSIGEIIASDAFALELLPMSAKGHDARCLTRGDVQIKITAGTSVALRHACNHLIVLKVLSPEMAEVVYDGPGAPVWQAVGKKQSNGQHTISIAKLKQLFAVGENQNQ